MKIKVSNKKVMAHKPGDLKSTHIQWHPGGKGATVTHTHEPQPMSKSSLSSPMYPTGASQDEAYGTREEAMHNVAKHAGVVSSLEDQPEPEDEGEEENEEAGAGVGSLKSEKPWKTRKKVPAVTLGGGVIEGGK